MPLRNRFHGPVHGIRINVPFSRGRLTVYSEHGWHYRFLYSQITSINFCHRFGNLARLMANSTEPIQGIARQARALAGRV